MKYEGHFRTCIYVISTCYRQWRKRNDLSQHTCIYFLPIISPPRLIHFSHQWGRWSSGTVFVLAQMAWWCHGSLVMASADSNSCPWSGPFTWANKKIIAWRWIQGIRRVYQHFPTPGLSHNDDTSVLNCSIEKWCHIPTVLIVSDTGHIHIIM